MNKKITKVAALSVGLAMAIGVGVALGSKGAKAAKAADYSAYKLDGTVVTSGTDDNNYNTESAVLQDELSWGVEGNTTMNPWRIGGKGDKGNVTKTYDRYVYSKAAVSSENISRIEFKVGTMSSSNFTVNSFALTVSSAEKGGGTVESTDNSKSITASSTITFNRPDGKDWSDKFFTFAVNVSCKGAKSSASNVYFQLVSIEFFYVVDVKEPDSVTVSGESEVAVGETTTLSALCKKGSESEGVNQNVIWSSSNPHVAIVSDTGVVKGIANGSATIRATAENVDTVYGEKQITVSGGKSDNTAIVLTPDDFPATYGDNTILVSGTLLRAKQIMKNDGVIQIQKTNGLLENLGALPFDISKIEISFNAEKAQGTGYAIKASVDGETYVSLEAEPIRSNRFAYSTPSAGYKYFQIVGPSANTLYLDEVLISLGNESEAGMVALASALNVLLDAECTGESDASKITAEKWAEIEAAYNASEDAAAKASLKTVSGASYIEVNQFLSRYDHIVGGYGYTNFLDREVPASRYAANSVFENNNSIMIIVITIASVSALAFTTLLLLKKRKQK